MQQCLFKVDAKWYKDIVRRCFDHGKKIYGRYEHARKKNNSIFFFIQAIFNIKLLATTKIHCLERRILELYNILTARTPLGTLKYVRDGGSSS